MSNSSLVNKRIITSHSSSRMGSKITTIIIHHMAGNLSIEQCGQVFRTRQASTHYGIGSDGRIGQYVDEAYRAWSVANKWGDAKAVTMELANDGGASTNWHVSDRAIEACINLCVDICRRNGITKLVFTGNLNGNLQMHRYYMATACPGPYLASKFSYIANEVNKRLGAGGYVAPSQSYITSDGKLVVDGLFGYQSVLKMQKWLGGQYRDGILSGQLRSCAKHIMNMKYGVQWGSGGSYTVRLLQRILGVKADGYIGHDTVCALQKYLNSKGYNLTVDGYAGNATCSAFQRYLNSVV